MATYETPERQIYETDNGEIVACFRATGVTRVLGPNAMGVGWSVTDVRGLFGGRWVWSSLDVGDEDEGTTDREDTLRDLRTNKRVKLKLIGSNASGVNELIGVPGAFVTAGPTGVTVHFVGGRTQTLSTDATAAGLATVGGRVYWNVNGVAHSATLRLPKADKARPRPKATKILRCKPRAGARLVQRWEDVIVTSVGRRYFACARRDQLSLGAVEDVRAVSNRQVAYTRGDKVGLLDVVSGTRTELPGTESVATPSRLLAAGPEGIRTQTEELSTEPASAPALAADRAYWLDAAGNPQTKALTPLPEDGDSMGR